MAHPARAEAEAAVAASPPEMPPLPAGASPLEAVKARWEVLLSLVKGKGNRYKLDGLLRSSCEPLRVEGDTLVLAFGYQTYLDKMEEELKDPRWRQALEDALAQVVGRPLKVSCTLVAKEKKASREAAPPKSGGHMVREATAQGARPVEKEKP